MKNFTYYRPTTVEQAAALLEQRFGNTELLGGGTDLHALQNNYVAHPARVVAPGQPCVIASPTTLAPALIALGATADIVGPTGARRALAMSQFYRAPRENNEREHTLAANEVVASVSIPARGMVNASYE